MIHETRQQVGVKAPAYQSQATQFSNPGSDHPLPHRYIFVPDPLIAAFARDPLAVGVYVAIARLACVAKGAVSVAARELCAWMGSDRAADRAAIMRRIVKLEERGWLVIARTTATKHALVPTWGRDQTGCVRPWCFDQADCDRPPHLRGRRVPLALLDDYIGRLDPQSGHNRALISRYFTRPLVDLVDVGAYTLGLRAEIASTPRLRHLGLCNETLMQTPASLQALLQQAQAGHLTTLVDDTPVRVALSMHGAARLSRELSVQPQQETLHGTEVPGSTDGSHDRSRDGSGTVAQEHHAPADADGQHVLAATSTSLIAWSVRMVNQETNHGSANLGQGGADGGGRHQKQCAMEQHQQLSTLLRQDELAHGCDHIAQFGQSLAQSIVEGHRMLNTHRAVLLGEWYELLELQQAHGAEQLLIWQARADRAATRRPHGIGPAYYRACATHAAQTRLKPAQQSHQPAPTECAPASVNPQLDSERDARLSNMGVRGRQQMADVSLAVIAAWQSALIHPGFAAQFASPIGFAVSQMRQGLFPPSVAELDGWVERTRQKAGQYQSERHVAATAYSTDALVAEQHLEARTRNLAPPNADVETLCAIAQLLETGATDAAIRAYLDITVQQPG